MAECYQFGDRRRTKMRPFIVILALIWPQWATYALIGAIFLMFAVYSLCAMAGRER